MSDVGSFVGEQFSADQHLMQLHQHFHELLAPMEQIRALLEQLNTPGPK